MSILQYPCTKWITRSRNKYQYIDQQSNYEHNALPTSSVIVQGTANKDGGGTYWYRASRAIAVIAPVSCIRGRKVARVHGITAYDIRE